MMRSWAGSTSRSFSVRADRPVKHSQQPLNSSSRTTRRQGSASSRPSSLTESYGTSSSLQPIRRADSCARKRRPLVGSPLIIYRKKPSIRIESAAARSISVCMRQNAGACCCGGSNTVHRVGSVGSGLTSPLSQAAIRPSRRSRAFRNPAAVFSGSKSGATRSNARRIAGV